MLEVVYNRAKKESPKMVDSIRLKLLPWAEPNAYALGRRTICVTQEELQVMLQKPNGNSFQEFRTWAIINMLLATGVRATELRELKVKSVNMDNRVLMLEHTKNRKPRAIHIPSSLYLVLQEYLHIRNGADSECLFCNIYGEPLTRTTLQNSVTKRGRCKKDTAESRSGITLDATVPITDSLTP